MKNLVDKGIGELRISTKNEYTIFTDIISKPDVKKTIHLRLANSKKNYKGKKDLSF